MLRVCFLTFIAGVFLIPSFAGAKTEKEEKPIYELDTIAYPDDKKGCENKAGLFVALLEMYQDGEPVSNFMPGKLFEPLAARVYENIRKNGVEEATLDNMRGYITCIKNAGPHRSQKRERDLTLKHSACVKFNAIILETLDGIKRRRKPESLMNKYQYSSPDMTWTGYEMIPDATLYYIANLYKASQSQSYKDVVQMASKVSVGCYL